MKREEKGRLAGGEARAWMVAGRGRAPRIRRACLYRLPFSRYWHIRALREGKRYLLLEEKKEISCLKSKYENRRATVG